MKAKRGCVLSYTKVVLKGVKQLCIHVYAARYLQTTEGGVCNGGLFRQDMDNK